MEKHGNYTLEQRGSIFCLTLFGDFNEQGVAAYVASMKSAINQLNGQPFMVLVDNSQLLGATPAAYQVSEEYNQWLSQQNLIAKATVYPNPMLQHLDCKMVPTKQSLNYQTFTTVDKAQAWLSKFNVN
ncbi:hypothetical protein [Thalassotalea ganghwensis]